MKKLLILVVVSSLAALAAACSTPETANKTAPVNTAPANIAPKTGARDDVPPSVHAVFPDAQSITKDHKDLNPAQIAEIEKETNSKLPDTDHHAYLAFSTSGGTRKQIGAASELSVGGKHVVVVYESRNGLPYIKEVRGEGLAQPFLDQFKGKGHDDKFQIGQDLKAQGADDATAKAVAAAIHVDIMTMETLYGAPHTH
jgi:hypothetical protein